MELKKFLQNGKSPTVISGSILMLPHVGRCRINYVSIPGECVHIDSLGIPQWLNAELIKYLVCFSRFACIRYYDGYTYIRPSVRRAYIINRQADVIVV